jgi:hypothetical protein
MLVYFSLHAFQNVKMFHTTHVSCNFTSSKIGCGVVGTISCIHHIQLGPFILPSYARLNHAIVSLGGTMAHVHITLLQQ